MIGKKKLAIALLASLALVASGCGSGEAETTESGSDAEVAEETAEDSTEEDGAAEEDGAEDDAMEDEAEDDDAMEDDASDEDAAGEDGAEDDATSLEDASLGDMLQAGAPFDDDILACFEDRDIDLSASAAEADDELMAAAGVASVVCNAEETVDIAVAEGIPDGVDEEQAKCAWREVFGALGELPIEEALIEFDSPSPSAEFRENVIPSIVDECGIDEDQVKALLDG